jgi:hypothetical protein
MVDREIKRLREAGDEGHERLQDDGENAAEHGYERASEIGSAGRKLRHPATHQFRGRFRIEDRADAN